MRNMLDKDIYKSYIGKKYTYKELSVIQSMWRFKDTNNHWNKPKEEDFPLKVVPCSEHYNFILESPTGKTVPFIINNLDGLEKEILELLVEVEDKVTIFKSRLELINE